MEYIKKRETGLIDSSYQPANIIYILFITFVMIFLKKRKPNDLKTLFYMPYFLCTILSAIH